MKKVFLLFLCSVFSFAAEWYPMGCKAKIFEIFIDTTSIKRVNEEIIEAWYKDLYNKPSVIGDIKSVKYVLYKKTCNHSTGSCAVSEMHYYNTSGLPIFSYAEELTSTVVPDSVGECVVSGLKFMEIGVYQMGREPSEIFVLKKDKHKK